MHGRPLVKEAMFFRNFIPTTVEVCVYSVLVPRGFDPFGQPQGSMLGLTKRIVASGDENDVYSTFSCSKRNSPIKTYCVISVAVSTVLQEYGKF